MFLSPLRGWPLFLVAHPRLDTLFAASRLACDSRFRADRRSETYSSFFFTLTTVIFAKPSGNDGGFSLAAMRRMMSSGTTRSRR